MQKKVIEHPFHPVSIDYDETKAWSLRDEKLLNLYLELHDAEQQRQEKTARLKGDYGVMEKQIQEMLNELKLVKARLAATSEVADHLPAQMKLHRPQAVEGFVNDVNTTNDLMQRYHQRLSALREEVVALDDRHRELFEEEEDETLWDRLSELKITYGYDANMSIDLVSFDLDEEGFRSKVSFTGRQNERAMSYCQRVNEQFNKLLLETETQYEVWAEFGKRLRILEEITGRDSGFEDIHLN